MPDDLVPDDLVRDMTEILTLFLRASLWQALRRQPGQACRGGSQWLELRGGKRKQPSTCPEGWLPAAVVVQLELTCRQERYAQRCVGIARFVYNRMVANDQAGRDVGLWLTPHELEKEFNAAKRVNPALGFVTEVSKFVAQGACRELPQRPLPLAEQRGEGPQTGIPQKEPHRRGLVPGRIGCCCHQV